MRWALVLSGGGGRGIAYVGVLKALHDLGLRPGLVVGTSIGAIMGGLYSSGRSPEELEDFVVNHFDIRNYLEGFTFRLGEGAFFRYLQAQEAFGLALVRRGVDSGKKIYKALLELSGRKRFEEADPAFVCNAVDLLSGREVVFESGLLADGIRASMSVPGIFAPFEHEGMLLSDGAVVNNLAVGLARKRGFRRVVAIDIAPMESVDADDLVNGFAVTFRALEIASHRAMEVETTKPSLKIVIDTGVSAFDFTKKRELIDLGYRTIMERRGELKSSLASRWRRVLTAIVGG